MLGLLAFSSVLFALFLALADAGEAWAGAALFATGVVCYLHILTLPMSKEDIQNAVKRQLRREFNRRFRFSASSSYRPPVDRADLPSCGGFIKWHEHTSSFAKTIAELLRHKKHEWIAIGMVKEETVVGVWFNKGANKHGVSCGMSIDSLGKRATDRGCDTLISIHNHPNPNSRKYDCTSASPEDLQSAKVWSEALKAYNISLIELVCDTGRAREYFRSCVILDEQVENLLKSAEKAAETGSGRVGLRLGTLKFTPKLTEIGGV